MTIAWANGQLSPVAQPAVRPDDRALFGIGVFETLLCSEGRVFVLERHLRRLARSAEGVGVSVDSDLVRGGVRNVLIQPESRAMTRGLMRVAVTGGPPGPVAGGPSGPPTTLVTLTAVEPRPGTARVWTCPFARNARGATTGLKTTSYAENGIALRHAHEHGSDQALFANTDGVLCEGAGSNVFVVVGEQIATPPLRSGCLAGVTRELLLEMASWHRRD
jgi:branched-chain amino acid aminotransferase